MTEVQAKCATMDFHDSAPMRLNPMQLSPNSGWRAMGAAAASVAILGLGVAALRTQTAHAASIAPSAVVIPTEHWLDALKGTHRQFFDTPNANGGLPLVHIMNYYDTYNKVYGVKDSDVNAVLTFYGGTTFYALNDVAWAKYRIGEFVEANDPATGKAALINPWRAAPTVLGMSLPPASLESLHHRGATLILCNNALTILSGLLAAKRGLDPQTVYADMKASILPGVELVPGMVIAVEQAEKAGLSYHRQ